MNNIEIIDTNAENILKYGVCGYKNIKREGYPEKIEWLKDRFPEGMKIKTLYSDKDGTQGMIEYIPGEYCWRPVEASGYMFIHCVFVGSKSAYKGKGYASLLVDECLKDARKENLHGVAVITRKGSFMAGKELFVKNGFEVVDKAPPDFELLVKKFNKNAPTPKFKGDWEKRLSQYGKGLTIIRADQCPYSVKNVREMSETAEKIYGIKPSIIDLKNCKEAQKSPCAFGTFCIVYNGKVIADHPISNKRFTNIMGKEVK
ncbi:GNAT family N-acetyltransferase [candidate division WOR-3 bacterium JGI_Cruoil_03_44_89]|uniref:GNAT family N-acetyltransferase n=1 Tax=candidate division WOR-3 bacterium JGI_Cruoil_03_44_89 TaxID=1973748 RepID=A0A235BYI3_UNCW3|nr:MAG: GNAT family N-acetyltransferase [candidate division WOR-3 bacterium JGI_Cruoil_03_44_89]